MKSSPLLSRFKKAFEATKYSLALGCGIYLFTANVSTISAVKGASMLPTFKPSGDMVKGSRAHVKLIIRC